MKHNKPDHLDKCSEMYSSDTEYYNENSEVLYWYAKKVIGLIRSNGFKKVLSLGIGQGIVAKTIINECDYLEKYTIVDGSGKLISDMKRGLGKIDFLEFIESLFENAVLDEKYDLIEMGFILEHVDDPVSVLKKYKGFLNKFGTFSISVPNANSLHRLIALKAGMIDDVHILSRFDLEVGHKRYFDIDSFSTTVKQAGLEIIKLEGILLKPFTTGQMKSLKLPEEVIRALCLIGDDYPEIANNIYIQAKPEEEEE